MQKTICEINTEALRANARFFKRRCGGKLCAVVKANAYGHGAEGCVAALSGVADYFAVALVEEALAVRDAAAGKEIWVLTPPTSAETVLVAARNGFVLCVPSLTAAKLVAGVAKKYGAAVKVHLKVNTGMNRYGMGASELGKTCRFLQGQPLVAVTGLYSHLYAHTRAKAEEQRLVFERARKVCLRYFPAVLTQLSATYGATLTKEFFYDAVRVGLGLYGYLPDGEYAEKPVLQRVMRLYAECVATRKYSFGGAGYAEPDGVLKGLSVVRVGYADGCGHAATKGYAGLKELAGAFCMDACIVKKRLKRGRLVLLFDDAERVAKERRTIVYEVLCLAGMRAEWVYY